MRAYKCYPIPLLIFILSLSGVFSQQPIPDRYYIRLQNGMALEASSSVLGNKYAGIQISSFNKHLNQLWEISFLDRGIFFIKNVGSNKALMVTEAGLNSNGGRVGFQLDNLGIVLNQSWKFKDLGNGKYNIYPGAGSGDKVLDVAGAQIETDGTMVQLWDSYNTVNQIWVLEKAFDRAVVRDNYVDLRGNQTPIKQQGSRGSCTYFGTLAALEAAYKKAGFGNIDLSEEFASVMYKLLYIHPIWSDIAHANYRENQFGGTQGGGALSWLATGLKIPLESDMPYRSEDYYPTNWDSRSQIEANEFNNSLLSPAMLKAIKYYGAKKTVSFSKDQLRKHQEYERILKLGYEISIQKRGHNLLLIGFDKRNLSDPKIILKNSWGPANAFCDDRNCGTEPYNELDSIISAEYITEITPPGAFPELAFLGSWKMKVDGQMGTLTIYHIPGIGNLHHDVFKRTGVSINDRRIGIFVDHLGRVYRVNGKIFGREIELFIHPVKQNLNWDELSGRHFKYSLGIKDIMRGYENPNSSNRRAAPDITR